MMVDFPTPAAPTTITKWVFIILNMNTDHTFIVSFLNFFKEIFKYDLFNGTLWEEYYEAEIDHPKHAEKSDCGLSTEEQ